MATVKTKWDQSDLDAKTKANIDIFLRSAGNAGQNEFAQNSPVITGALKNSMSYYIDDGRNSGGKDKVSKPSRQNTVRIGSGLIYAASVEKRGKSSGWMSKTWDRMIAFKVFEKIAQIMKI